MMKGQTRMSALTVTIHKQKNKRKIHKIYKKIQKTQTKQQLSPGRELSRDSDKNI